MPPGNQPPKINAPKPRLAIPEYHPSNDRKCHNVWYDFSAVEPQINRIIDVLDSRGIGVSRVDDQFAGLRHEDRWHHQDRGMSLSKPPVSPGTRNRHSARPFGRAGACAVTAWCWDLVACATL